MSHLLDITDIAADEANHRGWDLWKLRATFPGDSRARCARNTIAAALHALHWPVADIADALGFPSDGSCRYGIGKANARIFLVPRVGNQPKETP